MTEKTPHLDLTSIANEHQQDASESREKYLKLKEELGFNGDFDHYSKDDDEFEFGDGDSVLSGTQDGKPVEISYVSDDVEVLIDGSALSESEKEAYLKKYEKLLSEAQHMLSLADLGIQPNRL